MILITMIMIDSDDDNDDDDDDVDIDDTYLYDEHLKSHCVESDPLNSLQTRAHNCSSTSCIKYGWSDNEGVFHTDQR